MPVDAQSVFRSIFFPFVSLPFPEMAILVISTSAFHVLRSTPKSTPLFAELLKHMHTTCLALLFFFSFFFFSMWRIFSLYLHYFLNWAPTQILPIIIIQMLVLTRGQSPIKLPTNLVEGIWIKISVKSIKSIKRKTNININLSGWKNLFKMYLLHLIDNEY